jgi:hypothetical protein
MASIVEWQALKMQEYRYSLRAQIIRALASVGINHRQVGPPPIPAGDYDHALHVDHPDAPSLLKEHLPGPQTRHRHIGQRAKPIRHGAG